MKDNRMKVFPIVDVFLFERGSRLIEIDQVKGETAYISSTKKNNGINTYISPPSHMTIYENKMTLSNSGSVGYLFYHNYEFVASDHVTVIWIKDTSIKLTREIVLYLKPIFESMRYKYNFGREISDARLSKESILLPVDENDNPDWGYMEGYINNCLNLIEFEHVSTENVINNDLNVDDWKDFYYHKIFNIERGESEYLKYMNRGDYPYVSATALNHGISAFVDKYNRTENCIVLNYDGSVGECFYHTKPFFASEKVVTITLKERDLNKYIALFLITMIKQEKFRYSYGLKWSVGTRMKNSIIKLPALKSDDGNFIPDWSYMEEFIRSLPYSDNFIL